VVGQSRAERVYVRRNPLALVRPCVALVGEAAAEHCVGSSRLTTNQSGGVTAAVIQTLMEVRQSLRKRMLSRDLAVGSPLGVGVTSRSAVIALTMLDARTLGP